MTKPLKVKAIKGKVDFAVITIRTDEHDAVLDRLPDRQSVFGGEWNYNYAAFRNSADELIRVAVARTETQGHGAAQQLANDIVLDLNPKWIVLVGIAGGFPSDDFSLGDVVLASKVVDLSVTAAKKGGVTEYVVNAGPCHPDVEKFLAWLPGEKNRLPEWYLPAKLIHEKPDLQAPTDHTDDRLYGNEDHKKDVADALKLHFSESRAPLFAPAALGTSNMLVKDTQVVDEFTDVSRDIEHVEMEAGGVYRVCHRKRLPLLCVRGISDIVGFNRAPEWTLFACHSAAAFFDAIVNSLPRDAWGESLGKLKDWPRRTRWIVKGLVLIKGGCLHLAGRVHGTNIPTINKLKERIRKQSEWVLRFELPSENRIEFAVETELLDIASSCKVKLLLGQPGTGKTCLLAKVGTEFAKRGLPLLAIKADMFPHDVSFDEWGRTVIGYDLTFFDVVQAISANEELVVLIDQLDALASRVDQTSFRLNELVSFIAKCNELSNVHVISSCRDFEYTYDGRFKKLDAQTHALDLPSWEEVAELLGKHGHTIEGIGNSLREKLRVMQHLAVYLQLHESPNGDGGQDA